MDEEAKKTERRAYRSFTISISAAILLCFVGIFFGMALRNDALIRETLLARARSLFQEIVLARKWNAAYGGVYVLKGPGVESNPWLVDPDLAAADGRILTKRNPALMTREISAIADREASFRFRITSARPLNPANAPDAFEAEALALFESGKSETWTETREGAKPQFRYMGALKTEEACLACHAVQGYKVGDIRGGISVSFGFEEIARAQRANMLAIAGTGAAVSAALLWTVLSFFRSLKRKLELAREKLREAAITDGLTGLHNRRHLMGRLDEEFAKAKRMRGPLACALVDVDDFKKVNDELGHLAGDAALRGIAGLLREGTRPYDLLGRYGGEEFIAVFPASGAEEALAACERMRSAVESRLPALVGKPGRKFGVSIGIAALAPEDERTDSLIARADVALYRAKAAGKNRCVVFVPEGPESA